MSDLSHVAVIIPARWAATRLPGKPLADIHGKPMIQHVYERVMAAGVSVALVATDDQRIADAVARFGGRAAMTSPDCASGTDRVAEAARQLTQPIIINVQGDEPLLEPQMVRQAARPLLDDPALPMATLAHPITRAADLADPGVVKVVADARSQALYFSRAPIPYHRDRYGDCVPCRAENPVSEGEAIPPGVMQHVGIYGFRSEFLQTYAALEPAPLEQWEKLEQLRALWHGYAIHVGVTEHRVVGVDSPDDLERARALLAS
ncbi:3-deoxy-manno-octulosonate cytidylyltransferase [Magnetofaba australis]|uniref:3-deoxy-manno-octulosonate cytidylyltransferase n=1 Tax=Magnetofaba australis IT-1 TaxID=1434232 RepID=A0A1Y2K5Y8_9PROT|nr:3-deoxy-manno-octulosonate cytidylyltransferase [Magnetofaba australis]OSM04943.1 putative 3-deoxy-manno-octulosonate cytidylyltransferase [Magnetofaba australis IT-1]